MDISPAPAPAPAPAPLWPSAFDSSVCVDPSERPFDPLTGGRFAKFALLCPLSGESTEVLWAIRCPVLVARGSVVMLMMLGFCCFAVCGTYAGGRVTLTFERLCHEQLGGNADNT